MTGIKAKRARLLIGCGSAALCAVLMLMEHRASAQAFQATPTVAAGTVTIDRNTPGQDLITIGTRTAIIDWVPTEVGPVTLPYLPDGATATFQNGPAVSDFAVLNRILPTNNNAITQFDGAVISRLVNPLTGAATPGGFVAFYSPTGILVGATATFDVGSLMLTTLDPSPASFADFAENGGVMNLLGTQGSTARIQIDPGAQITASAENSFFAVVAADVQMFGNASINGSHAYVAGEIVNLSFSNGLFDIEVPFGTAASGNVLTLDGNIGGPASNGAGDNHVIYGVAAAAGDPISLLLSGNLGFAPAASAFVENGDIILAANFNVSGRQVAQGGWLDFGSDLEFEANNRTSQIEANIALSNATVTSRFLAAGTHSVVAEAALGGTSFARDVVLFGAETAGLRAERGGVLTVGGNANVLAHDYGSIDDMFLDDALGGRAFVSAIGDASVVQIDGLLRVDASAIAALDTGIGAQGNAIGGIVEVQAVDGRIVADGGISLLSYASRRALTTSAEAFLQGGGITVEARGASSAITTAGEISYATWARAANSIGGANGSSAGAGSSFTTAAEGAQIEALDGLSFDSFAIAGNAAGTDAGSAFGGSNVLFVEANSRIDTGGLAGITVDSSASAGRVVSGTQGRGGNAFGGFFDATVAELGTLAVDGSVGIDVSAFAGDGQTGGEASGGFGALRTEGGTINVTGDVFFLFGGFGGDASIGVGGDGGTGTGGGVFIEALETFSTPGSLTIAGFVSVDGLSFGGSGGAGDATTPGGRGGDGIGPPVIPDFGSAGIVVRASAENSQLRLGALDIFAAGFGGQGGDAVAGGQGGAGGTGEGATVFLGTFLPFSLPQSTNGLADLGTTVRVNADGVGGSAGGSGTQAGAAGAGLGGVIALTSSFGTVLAGETTLLAQGFGGQGLDGGFGRGGLVDIGTVFGGDLAFGSLRVNVAGEGDNGTSLGGEGLGGQARISLTNGTMDVAGDMFLFASGSGGNGQTGGDGTGGDIVISFNSGGLTVGGASELAASGSGGQGSVGPGGTGQGGAISLVASGGSAMTLDALDAISSGSGGGSTGGAGGAGLGGAISLLAEQASAIAVLGQTRMLSLAQGGAGSDGGAATGGDVVLQSEGAGSLLDLDITASSRATGGTASGGGTGGDAFSGAAILSVIDAAVIFRGTSELASEAFGGASATGPAGNAVASGVDASFAGSSTATGAQGQLQLRSAASAGGNGAAATSGDVAFTMSGDASVSLAAIDLVSSAVGAPGSAAAAGVARLSLANGNPQLTLGALDLTSEASGGATGTAGGFQIEVFAGQASITDLVALASATATGSAITALSRIQAVGGALTIANTLFAESRGDILVRTGQGGIIGSADPDALSVSINLVSLDGALTVEGDDDTLATLRSNVMTLEARELALAPGARIASNEVLITSRDDQNTLVLGGDTQGPGFTLTNAELGRIESGLVQISGSLLSPASPDEADFLIRDITLDGSAGRGITQLRVLGNTATGLIRTEGTVSLTNSQADRSLTLSAARIEVVTPGGLSVLGTDGLPTGFLTLSGQNIWVADADLIAQLRADPGFAGRNDTLAVAAQGSADPLGYLRGGTVLLQVGESLFVRNTGTEDAPGGILTGAGGLSIINSATNTALPPPPAFPPLEVFAYGRRQVDANTFATGEAFFREVGFNRTGNAPVTAYTAESFLNDCNINLGTCGDVPLLEIPLPPLNNPTVIIGPLEQGDPVILSPQDDDSRFGMDFPDFVDAPLIDEDAVVDDPVTTGGDAAIYAPKGAGGQ